MLGLLAEPDALAARAIVAQGMALDRVRETATKTLPAAAEAATTAAVAARTQT